MDNSEQSRTIAQHLYDRRHCVRYTIRKPGQTKRGTFPHPHVPHPYSHQERRPWWRTANEHFAKSPSYRVDSVAYHWVRRSIGKWIAAGCLLYRTVQSTSFRSMTRSLDTKCPDFGRKGITAEVGNLLCRCCFLVFSCVVLVSVFHCIVLFFFFATIFIAVEIWFVLW